MLPSWEQHRINRLVKTPKLHFADSGLACALLATDSKGLATDRSLLGQLIETFVLSGVAATSKLARDEPINFFHFRDRDDAEVDIVLERGTRELVGVEVKASATVSMRDFRGMHKLRDAAGKRFVAGVVLYDGEITASFGEGFFAVPIRALWETNWP